MKHLFFRVFPLFFLLIVPISAIVNTEVFRQDSALKKQSHQIDFGLALKDGNTELNRVNLKYRFDHFFKKGSVFFLSSLHKSYVRDERIVNNGFMHLRGAYEFFEATVLESFIQHQYDDFRDLSERILIGIGRRFHFSRDKTTVYLGLGVMLEDENRIDETRRIQQIRSTNYLSFLYPLHEIISFSGIVYYQPLLKKLDNSRTSLESELSIRLTESVRLSHNLQINYDTDPPQGVTRHDISVSASLGVRF